MAGLFKFSGSFLIFCPLVLLVMEKEVLESLSLWIIYFSCQFCQLLLCVLLSSVIGCVMVDTLERRAGWASGPPAGWQTFGARPNTFVSQELPLGGC